MSNKRRKFGAEAEASNGKVFCYSISRYRAEFGSTGLSAFAARKRQANANAGSSRKGASDDEQANKQRICLNEATPKDREVVIPAQKNHVLGRIEKFAGPSAKAASLSDIDDAARCVPHLIDSTALTLVVIRQTNQMTLKHLHRAHHFFYLLIEEIALSSQLRRMVRLLCNLHPAT